MVCPCGHGDGPHVPVEGLVHTWLLEQHVLPQAWLWGQHVPLMQTSPEPLQQTPAQQVLNGPQHTSPHTWLGDVQHLPLGRHAPFLQQTPPHTGAVGGQHTPSLQTSPVSQHVPLQDTGGLSAELGQQMLSVETLFGGQQCPLLRHTSPLSQHWPPLHGAVSGAQQTPFWESRHVLSFAQQAEPHVTGQHGAPPT
jgi:hypothetical protein